MVNILIISWSGCYDFVQFKKSTNNFFTYNIDEDDDDEDEDGMFYN